MGNLIVVLVVLAALAGLWMYLKYKTEKDRIKAEEKKAEQERIDNVINAAGNVAQEVVKGTKEGAVPVAGILDKLLGMLLKNKKSE